MSKLRRLKQKLQKERNKKNERQKVIFSFSFIVTMLISFVMLCIYAAKGEPTLPPIIISGCAWLLFDILFAYAIKNKWYLLFEQCSTGRVSFNYDKPEEERKNDNWEGNCFKFVISLIIFLIHLILFFVIL